MLNCDNVGHFEWSTKVINTTVKIIYIHFRWLGVIIVTQGGCATWHDWFQMSLDWIRRFLIPSLPSHLVV